MANRIPLVFDPTTNKIKELPSGDNLNLSNSSIVDAVNITASGTIVSGTVTTTNLNVGGSPIGAAALSNNYNDLDNLPTLFSGDYNDLINAPDGVAADWADITNKPSIPTKLSQLTNDTNFITNAQANIPYTQITGLATIASTGSWTDLIDKNQLVTKAEISGGTLTVDVNNTGDLEGSVYSTLGNLMVDGENEVFIGDITGNVTGNVEGDVTGNINSLDGGRRILYAGDLNREAVFRGDVIGQVFSPDDSSVLIDNAGNHYGNFRGDLEGSVFADDSTLMVDAVNGLLYGQLNTVRVESGTQLTLIATNALSIVSPGVGGSNGVISVTGNSVGITSSIDALVLESSSGDVNINASNGIVNVDALAFKVPIYANPTARDAAITAPEAGMMIFVSSLSQFQGWSGSAWVGLN